MPRFHFHVYDGASGLDRDGTELPDQQAARFEAIRHAGQIFLHEADHLVPGEDWRMEVTDEAGRVLFRLDVQLTESSVSSGLGRP